MCKFQVEFICLYPLSMKLATRATLHGTRCTCNNSMLILIYVTPRNTAHPEHFFLQFQIAEKKQL